MLGHLRQQFRNTNILCGRRNVFHFSAGLRARMRIPGFQLTHPAVHPQNDQRLRSFGPPPRRSANGHPRKCQRNSAGTQKLQNLSTSYVLHGFAISLFPFEISGLLNQVIHMRTPDYSAQRTTFTFNDSREFRTVKQRPHEIFHDSRLESAGPDISFQNLLRRSVHRIRSSNPAGSEKTSVLPADG